MIFKTIVLIASALCLAESSNAAVIRRGGGGNAGNCYIYEGEFKCDNSIPQQKVAEADVVKRDNGNCYIYEGEFVCDNSIPQQKVVEADVVKRD
ncbi:hypothetical protein HDU76_012280, partial [Blyttiomyces sp. JEL0837]